jgi:hypothetical protein
LSMRCALANIAAFSTQRPSVPTGSPHARVCPMDPHARTHQAPCMHARTGSPCMHAISPRSRTLHPMHAYTCPLDASCVHPSAVCIDVVVVVQ